MAKTAKKVVKRRRDRKNIEKGVAHIRSTFNNTIITITDTKGNAVSWASAGEMGFKGSRKSTPYAAQMAADHAAKLAADHGMKSVDDRLENCAALGVISAPAELLQYV